MAMFLLLLLLLHSTCSTEDFTCQPLSISLCSDLNYNRTRFPNEIGHNTQMDAANDLAPYADYFDSSCSSDIKLFLCSLYAPYCDGSGVKVRPCRELCIRVRDRCEGLIESHGFMWPNQWKCGRFPANEDHCVKPVEKPLPEPVHADTTAPFETEQPFVTQKIRTDPPLPVNHRCRDNEFFCDEQCYPLQWRCDKYADCKDGADESNCDKCLSNQFRCEDGSQCLPLYQRCDGYSDCQDGSDEEQCNSCSGNEFQCDRNRCIPVSYKCDGSLDCTDGTDEKECGDCSVGMFQCSNNICIDEVLECDGANDCGDNSDETSPTCYTVKPDPVDNTDKEDKGSDDGNETDGGPAYQCAAATRDCSMDTECKQEMLNYRTVCEQQMASEQMITCSKECYNAYYQLRSREPAGKLLIDQKCTELSVRNVKLSCIRQPASMACINALQKCTGECNALHERYSYACSDTLTQHDACSAQCMRDYQTFVESPLSSAILQNCIEVNTTIPVRCRGVNIHGLQSGFSQHHLSTSLLLSLVTVLLAPLAILR